MQHTICLLLHSGLFIDIKACHKCINIVDNSIDAWLVQVLIFNDWLIDKVSLEMFGKFRNWKKGIIFVKRWNENALNVLLTERDLRARIKNKLVSNQILCCMPWRFCTILLLYNTVQDYTEPEASWEETL